MVGVSNNGNANSNSFAKTICSICYEDLKPIVEDLQSISVCGHVFHELCLQQWFDYCPNTKKRSCPICKQTCTNANVGRLYFQSIGDTNDSSSQKPHDYGGNPEELQKEVNRLEGKVVALASTLEQQQKEFKEVKDELFVCKEHLQVEISQKKEAETQADSCRQLLLIKSKELDRSNLECTRVQERNMALAKELAALKLASDLDLEEDEVTKLASLGNAVGSRETVDVLRKSLINRNKSYKELLAKCHVLVRGEGRHHHKLEKAYEKVKKLKSRVQELETALEKKDNEALRVLKDQNFKLKSDSHVNRMKRPINQIDADETSDMEPITSCSKKVEPLQTMSTKIIMDYDLPGFTTHHQNVQVKGPSLTNEDANIVCLTTSLKGSSCENSMACADNNIIAEVCHVPIADSCFETNNDVENLKSVKKDGVSCSLSTRSGSMRDQACKLSANTYDEVICLDDTNPVQTSLYIRKEICSSIPVVQPGNHCFSGGLMGPDGTNWHLGKWCKKAQNQGSNTGAGDLIAVGADGKGGRIKVMRSLDQSSLDANDSSRGKRCKSGAKPNKLQTRGCLQMEHFYQRTGQ